MKLMILFTVLLLNLFIMISQSQASEQVNVQYHSYEINQLYTTKSPTQLSADYLQNYFSSKNPKAVIDQLLNADMTPLIREYILFNLLAEIAQQPPQAFHQDLVDRMKIHPIRATRTADEGHLPVAVFNLNSKAHGIENIWRAYRSEQRFNLLLKNNVVQAVVDIQAVLAQPNTKRRPQWLGIKNSIGNLNHEPLQQLVDYLSKEVSVNSGLDQLISHVGLLSGYIELIEKALLSNQSNVRQLTLRQLNKRLPSQQAKSLLIFNAKTGQERELSTSLLTQFIDDLKVETFLINQLNEPEIANNAAFALSQSNNVNLPQLLKKRYLLSTTVTEKNHLILALKLNRSGAAQMALQDLQAHIKQGSPTSQWLKSFDVQRSGEPQ